MLTFFKLRAYYSEGYRSCIAYNTGDFVLNIAGVLASDTLLLLLMLVGILRMREARQFGIGRYLYHQVRHDLPARIAPLNSMSTGCSVASDCPVS